MNILNQTIHQLEQGVISMINFASDYICGAHPEVLKRLNETNMEALTGYGTDKYSLSAKKKILEACGLKNGDVYFITGGTQTNQLVISTLCKDYEGVISATSGHVSVHEAGAIEYSGHKVLALNTEDGKLKAKQVDQYIKDFYNDGNYEHMVYPGMVYISQPTEYGGIYSKKELSDLSKVCKKHKIPLFIDGARLGYALMSKKADYTLKDIAKYASVFYIGGTKVGALTGEALVFTKNNCPKAFVAQIKQRGALLAKGRVNGVQFDTLFTNNLYFEISKHAIEMAEKLKELLVSKGYKFYIDSPTNQQFVIIDNKKMKQLSKHVIFSFIEKYSENETVIRFCTSWSTSEEDLNVLAKYL